MEHSADRCCPTLRRSKWLLLAAAALTLAFTAAMAPRYALLFGNVEHEVTSDYSHIRIRTRGSVRTMLFVRDSGEEVVESQLDLRRPHHLSVPYTRYMFLSYLYQPQPEKVLIVGLGGGSMVHFLQHHDPQVQVDAIEIDPVVVSLADEYFGVRTGGNVNVITGDGFDYLRTTDQRYDVIYMDAFLKPSDETDSTGAPLRLHTAPFYDDVKRRLNPGGVVVFNLNSHRRLVDDVRTIRNSFARTHRYHVPNTGNVVVVASPTAEPIAYSTLLATANRMDARFRTDFSFRTMARQLDR